MMSHPPLGAAVEFIVLEIARGRVLIPTEAKCALRGLGRYYFSPGFSQRCTRRSGARVTKSFGRRDWCSGASARNPRPTSPARGFGFDHGLVFDHGFSFHMARLSAAAKLTHKKYGTNRIAAARRTRTNSLIVQPTASHKATMSNSPASMFLRPKNSGGHSALSKSCTA